jgi:translation initiation factor 1
MKPKKDTGGVVYSTEHGRMCPGCSKPVAACVCGLNKTVTSGDGIVRIKRETKGRKGKGVTIITGIPLDHDKLQDLARQLKQQCATGGTVKDGIIEIQGDHQERLMGELQKRGYKTKT